MKQKRFRTGTIKVTGEETHHYFAANVKTDEMMRDYGQRVMVYTDPYVCMTAAEKRWPDDRVIVVVGMGDKKWRLFQSEMSYVLVK